MKEEEDGSSIDPDEIVLGELIGEGSFGKVYKGKCRSQEVAIKVLPEDLQRPSLMTLNNFKREVALLRSEHLRNPHVTLFMGACTQPGKLMIVQELLERDLKEQLIRKALTPLERIKVALDIALGMNWLHKAKPSPIIHGDLKPSNCLVDENMHVKLCDFGLSIKFEAAPLGTPGDRIRGTPLYLAPEVYNDKKTTTKSDVYSFGIILWQLITRKEPYCDSKLRRMSIDSLMAEITEENERPKISPKMKKRYPEYVELMQQCWHRDPQKRPPFSAIIDKLEAMRFQIEIPFEDGQKFWRTTSKDLAFWLPWDNFIEAFTHAIGRKESSDHKRLFQNTELEHLTKCLKALFESIQPVGTLSDKGVGRIYFGRFLEWFGPMISNDKADDIMSRVANLISKPWMHGPTTLQEAENKLRRQRPGTFLVRFSSSTPGHFAISVSEETSAGSSIGHRRIIHPPGDTKFSMKTDEIAHTYTSLQELIAKNNQVLIYPCHGSPFSELMDTVQLVGYKGRTTDEEEEEEEEDDSDEEEEPYHRFGTKTSSKEDSDTWGTTPDTKGWGHLIPNKSREGPSWASMEDA